MTVYSSKDSCSGCAVCSKVCPVGCIKMVTDNEGFIYSEIDKNKCINCGACTKVCHYNNKYERYPKNQVYAGQLEVSSELMNVSSGGVSWAIMESVIQAGGIVYGAAQIKPGDIRHERAITIEQARRFCGSKYLQSSLQDVLSQIKQDVYDKKKVLFTGTPCQIAALYSFLGKEYSNFYTCEIICHGVPSSKAYKKYLSYIEEKYGLKVVNVKNRNKEKGWQTNQYEIVFENGKCICEESTKNIFHAGYLQGLFNRPACASCKYAKLPRVADITLGDYWMYDGRLKVENNDKGISLVIVNSERGGELLQGARNRLILERSNIEDAEISCHHLCNAPVVSNKRELFFSLVDKLPYKSVYKKCMDKKGDKERMGVKVIKFLKKLQTREKTYDNEDVIKAYVKEMDKKCYFPRGIFELLLRAIKHKDRIAIIDNKVYAKICGFLHIEYMTYKDVSKIATTYFPLKDSICELTRRGIGVYFVNRVGKIRENSYFTESAQQRMRNHLSFPFMSERKEKYVADFKELLGSKYSFTYIDNLKKIPQIVHVGKKYLHEDICSDLVNTAAGVRKTVYGLPSCKRQLHVYGRCGAFGYAVEDADTMPSQLQKKLIDNGVMYSVVNHGLWGADDFQIDNNFLYDAKEFKKGDIVLFYRFHFDKRIIDKLKNVGLIYKEINEEFYEFSESKWCFYDEVGHLNRDGYRIVASLIYDFLKSTEFCPGIIKDSIERINYWDAYIKTDDTSEFMEELDGYINNILERFPLTSEIKKCGAIVMNCNPFTKGHRYLIEYASKKVDRLYIFVVEEDKSYFKFQDRFEMVKQGTKDIKNVIVIPSGKFMISALTFPQYFMKDYVKEKSFDASSDLNLFCSKIAPRLNISIRFAGQEPTDVVTNHYNEEMRRLLPLSGIKFEEIPRLKKDNDEYVSATKVRELLKNHDYESIKEYVPESTLNILGD